MGCGHPCWQACAETVDDRCDPGGQGLCQTVDNLSIQQLESPLKDRARAPGADNKLKKKLRLLQ
jgi:hypothetical protein